MQGEKKIKTIQEEISFCRDIGPRGGMTFPRSVRLHLVEMKNKRKRDFSGTDSIIYIVVTEIFIQ